MRALFLATRFPWLPRRGDQVRAYHLLRELALRHEITLAALVATPPSAEQVEAVASLGVDVRVLRLGRLGGARVPLRLARGDRRPLQALLYDRPRVVRRVAALAAEGGFDVVHALLVRTGPFLPEGGPPVVLDFVDALSANLDARSRRSRGPAAAAARWEARRIGAYERALLSRIDAGIVVSAREADALGSPSNVTVVPNGVGEEFFSASAARQAGRVLFAGNLGYFPNVDAARWIAEEIFPLILSRHPAATLRLAGARPAPAVRRLGRKRWVELAGEVPNMAAEATAAAVALVPLRAGSGVQNKVLEAMAAATPVVTTARVAEALGLVAGRHVEVGTDAGALADATSALLADPARATALGEAGREVAAARFRWPAAATAVEGVWEQVAGR